MYWLHAPLGVQFQPTEETLVSGYLLPKYRGEIFPDKFIAFSDDVYDKPPSEFCSDSTAFSGKHYFFTDLNRAKERAARTVGDYAYWHMSSKTKIENKNKEIIGYKKLLNFKLKGEGENTTDWFMHEYSLHLNKGESNNLGESKNLVLCVIQNKKEKGTGSCLVLGLDSGSGSERLEIAAMKSCSDAEIAEPKRGTGGLDQTVPQSDAEIASPSVPQSDAEILHRVLADDIVPQFDKETCEILMTSCLTDFLADSTTTANENPCPAQDEETQQRKKMRYSQLEELEDALLTDD